MIEQSAPQERTCTCTGTCKGQEGLAPGWRCALSKPAPDLDALLTDYERAFDARRCPVCDCGETGTCFCCGFKSLRDALRAQIDAAVEEVSIQRERLRQECGDYRRHIENAVRIIENEGNGQPSRCLDGLRRILHHYDHLRASVDDASPLESRSRRR